MVKLKRNTEITNEKFEGPQGIYWKSGTKGTATQFAAWVREFIRKQTTVTFDYGSDKDIKITNSSVKTSREFVSNDGQYETLNISFGRKDTVPLVVQAKVALNTNSIINLHYRPNPKSYKMVDKQFIIRDPNSLSVDPVSKKLVSVVFKGPQFSFAGQGRSLTSIPGYNQALNALDAPMVEAARILDHFDSEMFKSRNIRDYDLIPEIVELKEKYRDWDMDVDTSKIASKNVVTYIFNHPYNPDYSFTVEVRDEGGSTYYFTCRVGGEKVGGNLDYLNRQLEPELQRMQQGIDGSYSEYDSYEDQFFESKQLKKEMSVQGMSDIPLISDPEDRKKFDAFIKKLGNAIDDYSLARYANVDITQNPDGSEDWDLILKTQHTKKSDNPDGIISWRIEPALPLQFYQKDKNIHGEPITRVTYKDKVAATDIRTNFGYTPSVQSIELNSPAFFNEITKACAFFLDEYGAYNRQLATKTLLGKAEPNKDQKEILSLMNLNNQITPDQISDKLNLELNSVNDLLDDLQVNGFLRKVGSSWEVLIPVGKDWVQSYDKPDYDLSNWMDRTLAKIEPELERLQKEYNLSLEDKVEEVVTNTTADLLSQYNILLPQDRPQDSQYRDTSGKLVFTGSYIDKSFVDHLLELRVNFDRGDKFVVWIRPDLKGSNETKSTGQSDLSFFSNWVKQNVSPRTAQRSSDNYRQAISQELINLGAIEGRIKGTLDISTSKIKEVTIDLKVTNNQVLVNAYRDGKIIDKFALDIKPFTEKPNKVARTILNQLSKHIKESYPSIDRQKPVSDQYWKAVFEHLKKENGIQLQSSFNENYIIVGTKKCRAQFNPIGTVKLTTMTGREIVEEQFNADPRYFLEDYQSMNNLINEKKNLF